ncbi:MAG: hypothetical protein LBF28_03195 [Rickettsiales bacterium]|jgi:hypothetical protein|nr:hypothetical protein [Rickettsiales bacterium]
MKKILLIPLLIVNSLLFVGSAFAEGMSEAMPEKAKIETQKHEHDYTGSFWIQYGINGSLMFTPNNEVIQNFKAATGENPTIDTGFAAVELRLGYQVNQWLGLWAGGMYVPFSRSSSDIVQKTRQEEIIPGVPLYQTKTYWYELVTDVKYKEYFTGARIRIGEAGGLYAIARRLGAKGLYWFADVGVTRREMDVTYSGFFEFEMKPYTEKVRKNAPFFGIGTEIMFGPKQSINIDANAKDFLSTIGTFGMSIFFKRYF